MTKKYFLWLFALCLIEGQSRVLGSYPSGSANELMVLASLND